VKNTTKTLSQGANLNCFETTFHRKTQASSFLWLYAHEVLSYNVIAV